MVSVKCVSIITTVLLCHKQSSFVTSSLVVHAHGESSNGNGGKHSGASWSYTYEKGAKGTSKAPTSAKKRKSSEKAPKAPTITKSSKIHTTKKSPKKSWSYGSPKSKKSPSPISTQPPTAAISSPSPTPSTTLSQESVTGSPSVPVGEDVTIPSPVPPTAAISSPNPTSGTTLSQEIDTGSPSATVVENEAIPLTAAPYATGDVIYNRSIQCTEDTQGLDDAEQTTVQFNYEISVDKLTIDDNEEVNKILDSLEAATISHLSQVSKCAAGRKLHEAKRRHLQLMKMEFLDSRNIAENTCVAGRSQASCEVTASSSIEVSTDGTDSSSEICSIVAVIKNFFDEVFKSGDVDGIDEADFKGSEYACSGKSDGEHIVTNGENKVSDEVDIVQEPTKSPTPIVWYFVSGLTFVLFIVASVNGTRTRRQRVMDSFESDHLKNSTVDEYDSNTVTFSLASKSLFSGMFDWSTGLIDDQPADSNTSLLGNFSSNADSKLSNASKSLFSGTFDLSTGQIDMDPGDIECCASSRISDLGTTF